MQKHVKGTRARGDRPGLVIRWARWGLAAGVAWLCGACVDLADAQESASSPLNPLPAGVAPQQPPANPPQTVAPPGAKAPSAEAGTEQILPALEGLRLVDAVGKINPQGVTDKGVVIDGLPILDEPEIRAKLAAYLGKPVTMDGLRSIYGIVVNWYRAHHRPFVDAFAPEQNATAGTVQILVIESRVGSVGVPGATWSPPDMLRHELGLAPGDPIDDRRLTLGLGVINENPFRSVHVEAQPGKDVGTTNLDLFTQDRFPLRVYAGYDNSGQPATGHDRWNLGFNWGNALWLDQRFSYQFTSSDDFWHHRADIPGASSDPSFIAHSIDWIMPLPWQDEIELIGAYSEQVPRLGPGFGSAGISGQASLRYIVHLLAPPGMRQRLEVGYDFKTTNNNLSFGGVLVTAGSNEIDQFPLIYSGSSDDRYGRTLIDNSFVFSPGGLTGGNKSNLFQPTPTQSGVAGASAHYVYDRLRVTRVTAGPKDVSWWLTVTTQFADHTLLQSEQLSAGGIDSVRGYDEFTAGGTRGVIVNNELRSPKFALAKYLGASLPDDAAQFDVFFDYADVYNETAQPGSPSSVQLDSTGIGLRYDLGRYLTSRLEFGWQLRNQPGSMSHAKFGQATFTLSY